MYTVQVENSALRARVEGAIATTEEELRLLPDRVIRQASSQLHDSHTGKHGVTAWCHNMSHVLLQPEQCYYFTVTLLPMSFSRLQSTQILEELVPVKDHSYSSVSF